MNDTTAEVIADSCVDGGRRLTTMVVRFPRFLLPQFNTHRVFSRNTASSRAIPTEKLIARVRDYPVLPTYIGKNQPGMSASEALAEMAQLRAIAALRELAEITSQYVTELSRLGVHKQTANRYLEPFLMTTVIVTATEWDNFFALRLHHSTQPEMQDLARVMKSALDTSTPNENDGWHLPFGDRIKTTVPLEMLYIAAARCARVSYETHGGDTDEAKDLELAKRLKADGHWSPFEHIAYPIRPGGVVSGNLKGWDSLRSMLEGNRT